MDRLDTDVLRELTRDRVMWWGSTDPRLSANEVAKRLKVPPSTVRDRLAAWKKSGFLPGTEVLPSPRLFGVAIAGTSVRVGDPRRKEDVLRDLGLVDGVLTAMDLVGPWFAVVVANEGPAPLERLRRLIARLRGVEEVLPCVPASAPECSAQPTPLDWRILAAARRTGRASLGAAAKAAGVSAKTFARRYDALIRARAVWVLPLWDFSRFTHGSVVRFIVELEDGADSRSVTSDVRARQSDLLEVFTPGEVLGGVPRDWIEVWVHVLGAAQAEDVECGLRSVKGVADVTAYFPRRFVAYPSWFDERVATKVAARAR